MAERYELLELLGKGGFGRVYLARYHGEAGFQKDVALKFLKSGAQDNHDLIARLRDEARLLGLLRHRAIVHVDRLIRLQGAWVIVMEYVPGDDLSTLMQAGPVPAGPALEVLSEVASALTAAFERPTPDGQALRLTHRDIKPGNIRLTSFGDVKVLDFGIARAEFAGQELAGETAIVGTPAYMAPERFEGLDGPASDIYALGVVAYEMLMAERFGPRQSTRKAHREHVKARTQDLRLCAGLPEEAAALIARMLNHDPTLRPSTDEVGRACRRLASTCDTTLAEWVKATLAVAPAENPATWAPEAFKGPRTSIILSDDEHAELAEGSLLNEATGAVNDPDLTGQMIGQSFVPDSNESVSTLAGAAPDTLENPSQTGDLTEVRQPSTWLAGALVLVVLAFMGFQFQGTLTDVPSAGPQTRAADAEPPAAPSGEKDGPGSRAAVPPSATADPSTSEAPRAAKPEEATGPAGEPPERAADAASEPTGTASGARKNTATPKARETPKTPKAKKASANDFPDPGRLVKDPSSAVPPPTPPPPPPAAPAGVAVRVTGDAQSVQLKGQGRTHSLPGTVPPGRYEIRVAFPGEPSETAGAVTVVEGTPLTLKCERMWRECTPQ